MQCKCSTIHSPATHGYQHIECQHAPPTRFSPTAPSPPDYHLPLVMSSSMQISPTIAPYHKNKEDSQRRGLPTAPACQTLASPGRGPTLGPNLQNTDVHRAGACPRHQVTKHQWCAMARGWSKAPAPQPPQLLCGPKPTNDRFFGGWGMPKTLGHQTESQPQTSLCMRLRIHPPPLGPTPIQTHTHKHTHTHTHKIAKEMSTPRHRMAKTSSPGPSKKRKHHVQHK